MTINIQTRKDYSATILANTKPEIAFEKISKVGSWWAGSFKGNASKKSDNFSVSFNETRVDFLIEESEPPKKYVWLVTDCHLPWLKNKKEWKGSRVEFDLNQVNDQVEINMVHRGLVPGIECYDGCEKGWEFFIKKSLLEFLNTGKGLPDTPGNKRG